MSSSLWRLQTPSGRVPLLMEAEEQWTQEDIFGLRDRYRDLLVVLGTAPRAVALVAELVPPTEVDALAHALLHIYTTLGPGHQRLLSMIRELVAAEFEASAGQSGAAH